MKLLPFLLLLSLTCCGQKTSKTTEAQNITPSTKAATLGKTFASGSVHVITEEDFDKIVLNYTAWNEQSKPETDWEYLGDLPCIVDFYADWCGPCRKIAPILDELAIEYKDKLIIYKVNVDKARNLSAFFGVQNIPTMLFVPQKGLPQLNTGAMGKNDLKKIIDEFVLARP